MPPTFRSRACPLCGGTEGATLFAPEAEEFCSTNSTYDPRWRELLDLPKPSHFPIRRCARCGFVFAELLPDDDFLAALYDRVIVEERCVEGSEFSESYAARLRSVADLLELTKRLPQRKALDYGSGAGVTLRILAACNVDAVGFEPSAMRAEYSRAKGMRVVSDTQSLADNAPFAMLIFDDVLEHLPDPVATIQHLGSLTAPGAAAFVSSPSFEEPALQRQIEQHRRGAPMRRTVNPWEHLSYFSRATLDRLMERGGFHPIAPHELGRAPDIGLRAERGTVARMKNSAMSIARALRWAATGADLASVERRYYRRLA
ncbi:MAG TPA: class I SAM-dependent methyltransferase [Thermoanaerobaculia bacterium]|nr:class I SAM-dependent methyltransferase [Thermoanaerobaculia bacterium]